MTDAIDAVIAYVDAADPSFAADLTKYAQLDGIDVQLRRFRSYGTLSVLIKCIKANMKFIRRMYVVVCSESQIPDECKGLSDVVFVTHDRIIPAQHLPTFNSQTIEMFLHRIPGLADRFVYFNDDMFPIRPLQETDFFKSGRPVWRLKTWTLEQICNSFRNVCFNSYATACKACGKGFQPNKTLVPCHSPAPMFRLDCDEVFDTCKTDILESLTRFRKSFNMNQYLFSVYSILKRGFEPQQGRFFKYTLVKNFNPRLLSNASIICINDCDSDDIVDFSQIRQWLELKCQ